jgi:hypothetical protein
MRGGNLTTKDLTNENCNITAFRSLLFKIDPLAPNVLPMHRSLLPNAAKRIEAKPAANLISLRHYKTLPAVTDSVFKTDPDLFLEVDDFAILLRNQLPSG